VTRVRICLALQDDSPGDLFPARCKLMRGHQSPHHATGGWGQSIQWTNDEVDHV
jgi:hypothetical protein